MNPLSKWLQLKFPLVGQSFSRRVFGAGLSAPRTQLGFRSDILAIETHRNARRDREIPARDSISPSISVERYTPVAVLAPSKLEYRARYPDARPFLATRILVSAKTSQA